MTRFPYHTSRRPPIPAVTPTLRSRDGLHSVPAVPAYLDTAADITVVPLHLVRQLGITPVGQAGVRGLGEAQVSVDVYEIDIEIPHISIVSVLVIAHPDEPAVLIGRDILNLFRVTFDGPNQTVEFH
jgi:predicted aspartyl protease